MERATFIYLNDIIKSFFNCFCYFESVFVFFIAQSMVAFKDYCLYAQMLFAAKLSLILQYTIDNTTIRLFRFLFVILLHFYIIMWKTT